MLTILASFAQEESLSASENQKWRVQRAFENGELINFRFMFGYKITKDGVKVNPAEAEIVREIFRRAIDGEALYSIAADLTRREVKTTLGGNWSYLRIKEILSNEKYTGNALLMKRFRNNHLEKKLVENRGERTQYYAEETHDAIIDAGTFDQAQEILSQISEEYVNRAPRKFSFFTGLIRCGYCGKNYTRRSNHGVAFWDCYTYVKVGCEKCHSGRIREETLYELAREVAGTEDLSQITQISAKDHVLTFRLKDGTTEKRPYCLKSRSESWTPDMKKKASEKEAARRRKA